MSYSTIKKEFDQIIDDYLVNFKDVGGFLICKIQKELVTELRLVRIIRRIRKRFNIINFKKIQL